MRGSPVVIGLLVGLIVILVICGVSLLVKINVLASDYDKQLAEKRDCEVMIEKLKGENSELTTTIEELNSQLETLQDEKKGLNNLKETLEDSLKNELMESKKNRRKKVKE